MGGTAVKHEIRGCRFASITVDLSTGKNHYTPDVVSKDTYRMYCIMIVNGNMVTKISLFNYYYY